MLCYGRCVKFKTNCSVVFFFFVCVKLLLPDEYIVKGDM